MKVRVGFLLLLAGLLAAGLSLYPGLRRFPYARGPAPRTADTTRVVLNPNEPEPAWVAKKEVIFVPTPDSVVDAMMQVANVTSRDVVYDLGSGDGRIVISAAKLGARSVGFEIDPDLIVRSRDSIRTERLQGVAEIRNQDIHTVDFSRATVVTMYLLLHVNLKLKPKLLAELPPGARIVTHSFDMGNWTPDTTFMVGETPVFMWTVPARK